MNHNYTNLPTPILRSIVKGTANYIHELTMELFEYKPGSKEAQPVLDELDEQHRGMMKALRILIARKETIS